MSCGIYKIVNHINGKFYLGSSVNIENRWSKHKSQLKNNRHENIYLQRAYNIHGISNFSIEVIELTLKECIKTIEQKYLDELKPWDNSIGYNLSKTASGGDCISYHPNNNEFRQKQSKIQKERYANMSKKEKEIMSQKSKGKNNGNWKGGKNFF